MDTQRPPLALSVAEQAPDEHPFALLARALDEAGFWDHLDRHRTAAGAAPEAFRVLIKPDLEVFDAAGPTGTDPALVEHLIDLLGERGYTRVAVGDGPSAAGTWLENRDVGALADLAGYRFVTEGGRDYEVLDLSEDLVDAGFEEGDALHGEELARAWLEASFRISFATCKTDEDEFFALGLQNLLGVLPLRDKGYHYYGRHQPWDAALDLLRRTPAHFALIDAVESNHGSQGSRAPNPLATNTLIASDDLLLADFAAALKMELDPYASRLNGHALRTLGLPTGYRLQGSLAPFDGWKSPSLALVTSVRRRNASPAVRRLVRPWLQTVNTELFPFKHVVDAQVNATLAPLAAAPDAHPLAAGGLLLLNAAFAALERGLTAWQTLYDKGRLWRRDLPLGFDPGAFEPADYDDVADYVRPLEEVVRHTPPDRNGLRWRYLDGSVLFGYTRTLPLPYDDFVERVPIARAVEMMYDNIGGRRVVVDRDPAGRVRYQAERDVYLPQPNWMVLFGGAPIDVGKIEAVDYERDRQEIVWRAITSANDSAAFDDGLVRFSRHAGGVEVRVVARQKFALPLLWQAIDLDYVPALKDTLVSDAYVRFFTRTLANYEAAYEGRDPALGRRWDVGHGEDAAHHPLAAFQLDDLTALFSGFLERWVARSNGTAAPGAGTVDEHGYRHFAGHTNEQGDAAPGEVAQTFLADVAEAVRKDIRWVARPDAGESS